MTQEEFLSIYRFDPENDLINEGGFGKIYRAWGEHDREIVIKVVPVKSSKYTLKYEVELASKVREHKNIAYYESVYSFNIPLVGMMEYAIMQYYPEGDLKKVIESYNLSLPEKHDILKGILTGLDYLHNNKILHRDIKPGNILMQKIMGKWTPKITDFGIGKDFSASSNSISNTSAGIVSLMYASPEQIRGESKTLTNTDLWPIGAITHLLFTGKTLFSSDKPKDTEAYRADITSKITMGKLPASIDEIPEPYKTVALRCLVVDPLKRAGSASELLGLIPSVPEEGNESESNLWNRIYKGKTSTELKDAQRYRELFPEGFHTKEAIEVIAFHKEKTEWEKCRTANSSEAIQKYLNKYPQGSFTVEATVLLNQMGKETVPNAEKTRILGSIIIPEKNNNQSVQTEESDFDSAMASQNKIRLQAFLDRYPDSQHAAQIEEAIETIDWKTVKSADSIPALETYTTTYGQKGKYYHDAKRRIEEIRDKELETAFYAAVRSQSTKTLKEFNAKFPGNRYSKNVIEKIEELDWNYATSINTVDSYQEYKKAYGAGGKFKAEADKQISIIQEETVTTAFRHAMESKNIQAIRHFLNRYPDSKYEKEAHERIESLSWEIASNENTVAALQNYISTFGEKAKFRKEALNLIETIKEKAIEAAYHKAVKSKSVQVLESFIQDYPHGAYRQKALEQIDTLRYNTAIASGRISELENFVKQYPDSWHKADALRDIIRIKESLDLSAWEKACHFNTPQAYEQYINGFPNGKYIDKAKKAIEELSWNLASNINSVEAYDSHLKQFPDGFFAKKARELKTQLTEERNQRDENHWDRVQKSMSIASLKEYLRDYKSPNHKAEAGEKLAELKTKRRKKANRITLVVFVLVVSVIVVISLIPTERSRWEDAKATNTYAAYESFHEQYPNGEYRHEAVERMADIVIGQGDTMQMRLFSVRYGSSDAAYRVNEKLKELWGLTLDSLITLSRTLADEAKSLCEEADKAKPYDYSGGVDKLIESSLNCETILGSPYSSETMKEKAHEQIESNNTWVKNRKQSLESDKANTLGEEFRQYYSARIQQLERYNSEIK